MMYHPRATEEGRSMGGSVVTVGTFDGVHLGHQAVLDAVDRIASERNADRVACTFAIPPRRANSQGIAPLLLLPLALRVRLLHRSVDRVIRLSFAKVRDLSPQAFAEQFLVDRLNATTVVVGHDFRFGVGRQGSLNSLVSLGPSLGFEVRGIDAVQVDGQPVSSTRIRACLMDGRARDAASLLGRPPILVGHVVAGDHLGRRLGYPTINLSLPREILIPRDGIYVAHAFWRDGASHALLYLGRRPTLWAGEARCEVHFTQPHRVEQGARVEVHVLERLRDDRAFSSLDALREQIGRDVEAARSREGRYPLTGGPIGG